jgi:hypothetical protein
MAKMSALEQTLDGSVEQLLEWPSEQTVSSTRREIIAWWESRRLRFNHYLGTIGIISWLLILVAGSAAVKPGVDFEEPIVMILGPFIYAFFANICYTLGWIVDTVAYRRMPRMSLYKSGIVFSAILTALPGLWAVAAWLMTVIMGHKLD